MGNRFTRRQFLAGTLDIGIGAAAVSAVGVLGEPLLGRAAASPTTVSPPGEPASHRSYVSRPDLLPPGVTISQAVGAAFLPGEPQYIFLAPRVTVGGTYPAGTQPGLMIIDRYGDLIWFKPMTGAGNDPFNFRVQSYGGKPVLTWFQGSVGLTGFAVAGSYAVANSSYRQIATVTANGIPSDLHEFLLTPQGTALLSAYEPDKATNLVIGHAQEVDVATNDELFDWPCYPAVPTSESYVKTTDYFHLNSVDLWPGSERNLLISARNTSTVYLVSRATKKVIWQIGGRASSFKMVGPGTRFGFQHDARALPDGSGISVFDDGSQPSVEKQSWGKVFNVDSSTKQVTLRHQYNHTTTRINTGSQGNCQLLPTGGHLVGWGADPYFSEFAPSGPGVESQMILDGRLPAGVESYRTFMSYWTGNPPLSEIALVVHRGAASGAFTAYVSWNGATEIHLWRISAGTSPRTLTSVATAKKGSFETTVSFTASAATVFEATAYTSSGKILGTSRVVAAT
jgi:Arylsulfotransferase (ASST)